MIFDDSGVLNTTDTRIVVNQLIPSTTYRFTVSVITESGEGEEVVRMSTTTEATQGRDGLKCLLHYILALYTMYSSDNKHCRFRSVLTLVTHMYNVCKTVN